MQSCRPDPNTDCHAFSHLLIHGGDRHPFNEFVVHCDPIALALAVVIALVIVVRHAYDECFSFRKHKHDNSALGVAVVHSECFPLGPTAVSFSIPQCVSLERLGSDTVVFGGTACVLTNSERLNNVVIVGTPICDSFPHNICVSLAQQLDHSPLARRRFTSSQYSHGNQ